MVIDPATDGGLVIRIFMNISTETPKIDTSSYKCIHTIKSDGYVSIIYDEAERCRQVRRRLGNKK